MAGIATLVSTVGLLASAGFAAAAAQPGGSVTASFASRDCHDQYGVLTATAAFNGDYVNVELDTEAGIYSVNQQLSASEDAELALPVPYTTPGGDYTAKVYDAGRTAGGADEALLYTATVHIDNAEHACDPNYGGPVASFTVTEQGTTLDFDASASTDHDGSSITKYVLNTDCAVVSWQPCPSDNKVLTFSSPTFSYNYDKFVNDNDDTGSQVVQATLTVADSTTTSDAVSQTVTVTPGTLALPRPFSPHLASFHKKNGVLDETVSNQETYPVTYKGIVYLDDLTTVVKTFTLPLQPGHGQTYKATGLAAGQYLVLVQGNDGSADSVFGAVKTVKTFNPRIRLKHYFPKLREASVLIDNPQSRSNTDGFLTVVDNGRYWHYKVFLGSSDREVDPKLPFGHHLMKVYASVTKHSHKHLVAKRYYTQRHKH